MLKFGGHFRFSVRCVERERRGCGCPAEIRRWLLRSCAACCCVSLCRERKTINNKERGENGVGK
ncbi:hypothetical protein LguiA_023135 [Lonicera macranthoides]